MFNSATFKETGTSCRHLGLADSAFVQQPAPSDDHRCFLWNQRSRVDLEHQRAFCLTAANGSCPWLLFPPRRREARIPS